MIAKLRIKFWWLTAGSARWAGGLLYATAPTTQPGHDPFSIPTEYARVFFPLMHIAWALALASQIVEIYGLPERSPYPSAYWPAHVTAYADVVIRFGGLAFGLTLLLIPLTIVLVKQGRMLMTLAQRIERLILPASIREEIETGIAAGINEAVEKAVNKAVDQAVDRTASETRNQVNTAWHEWLARRDRAQALGVPFSEPPPSETATTN